MTDTHRPFNGLNGTIMLNTARDGIAVGRVSGESYGYQRNLLVTVDLRIEREERRESYETVEHDTVTAPYGFAITTNVWRPDRRDIVAGGATVEPLRELVTYERGFDAATVARLADLDQWHLNTMTAACAHMPNLVTEPNGYGGTRIACGPANTCEAGSGYTYGRAWLVRPLPDGFMSDLLDILSGTEPSKLYTHPDTGRDTYAARGYDGAGNAIPRTGE